MKQLEHLGRLIEFFTYIAQISFRFAKEYVPSLKEETDKRLRMKKNELVKEIK